MSSRKPRVTPRSVRTRKEKQLEAKLRAAGKGHTGLRKLSEKEIVGAFLDYTNYVLGRRTTAVMRGPDLTRMRRIPQVAVKTLVYDFLLGRPDELIRILRELEPHENPKVLLRGMLMSLGPGQQARMICDVLRYGAKERPFKYAFENIRGVGLFIGLEGRQVKRAEVLARALQPERAYFLGRVVGEDFKAFLSGLGQSTDAFFKGMKPGTFQQFLEGVGIEGFKKLREACSKSEISVIRNRIPNMIRGIGSSEEKTRILLRFLQKEGLKKIRTLEDFERWFEPPKGVRKALKRLRRKKP